MNLQNYTFPTINFNHFSILTLSFSTFVAWYLVKLAKIIHRNFRKTLWEENCMMEEKTCEKLTCTVKEKVIEDISNHEKPNAENLVALAINSRLSFKLRTPGLVGVLISNDIASIVEVNCSTEETAKSEYFRETVEIIANACLEYGKSFTERIMPVYKVCYDFTHNDDIKHGGKSVNDYLDLLSETTGERVVLRRAMTCRTHNEDVRFYGYAYPHLAVNKTILGKIGSVVAVQNFEKSNKEVLDDVGLKLSQHIVAMAPLSINTDPDVLIEKSLNGQKFLHNNKITVLDLLDQNKLTVIDFCRYECGEMDLSLQEIMRMRRRM